MILTDNGHLKLIDLGTAKDLIETDLNGQEFVGTPEYMSPQTVEAKKTSNVGIEADIWALGVVLYQLFMGITPFTAPSPYLMFLKIKKGTLHVRSFLLIICSFFFLHFFFRLKIDSFMGSSSCVFLDPFLART
jgi:serine/threonine protein kinase